MVSTQHCQLEAWVACRSSLKSTIVVRLPLGHIGHIPIFSGYISGLAAGQLAVFCRLCSCCDVSGGKCFLSLGDQSFQARSGCSNSAGFSIGFGWCGARRRFGRRHFFLHCHADCEYISCHTGATDWAWSSPLLSNKDLFPYYLRTFPPDTFQGKAFWSWVLKYDIPLAVCIYSEEAYGMGLFQAMKDEARLAGDTAMNGTYCFRKSLRIHLLNLAA